MKSPRVASFVASALAAAAVVLLSVWVWNRATLSVEVENISGSQLSNVRVTFEGGAVTMPNLANAAKARRRIKVGSESGLALSFLDANGTPHQTNLNVYVERGFAELFG